MTGHILFSPSPHSHYHFITDCGTFYIEDTATDVTYTTLSGDLTASSLCLTITEAAPYCYKIVWKDLLTTGYVVDSILLGEDTINIIDTSFPDSKTLLVDNINNANDDRVKVIGYNYYKTISNSIITYNSAYILKVLGTEVPILKVKNSDNSAYMYFHGELQGDCLPQTGFTIVDPCYNTLPPAL